MRYHYVAVFQVVGLLRPVDGQDGPEIRFPGVSARARLTGDLNAVPIEVDRGAALRSTLMKGLFSAADDRTPQQRLDLEMTNIRQRRQQESGGNMLVVFEAEGEVDDFELEPSREGDGYIVAIVDWPKEAIHARYEARINALLAAVALSSEHVRSVKNIAGGVTFFRANGMPVHCLQLQATGHAYVASPMAQDAMAFVSKSADVLSRHQAYAESARLLTRSLHESSDPLLSFLSVWAGLEIFVNKNFKQHEERIFGRLSSDDPPLVPPAVVKRIRDVMFDKYRLTDKFAVIAAELCSHDSQADLATFQSLKVLRDRLLHGEDVPLDSLPSEDARRLLRKYLKGHLEIRN